MILMELAAPEAEPITLAEAKGWARIERADEDALLAQLIAAARESVEAETGLILSRRRFRLFVEEIGPDGYVDARRGPLREITDLRAYGADGNATNFAAGGAELAPSRGPNWLRIGEAAKRAGRNGIELDLEAGWDPEEVPEALKVAILRIAATAYETRGAFAVEMQPAIVPPLAAALIRPFRRVSL